MACNHIIYSYKFSTDIQKMQDVAENTELSKTDLRLFLFLSCKMGSTHLYKVDKKQVAKSLNVSKKDIEKSLNHLENLCIIESGSDDHLKKAYRMSYTDEE